MSIEQARFNMIEQQIRPWDVLDQGVLSLLAVVKREDFVPAEHRAKAFFDTEIPLGHGQFMLPPRVEARFLQELDVRKHERVLEIGTGSGYQAALLAHKAREVVSIEVQPELAKTAIANLRRASITNAVVLEGDASKGLPTQGPFDVIVLSGSVAAVPKSLLTELKVGGRLIAIVGQEPVMRATIVTRVGDQEFRNVEVFDTVAPRLSGFDEPSRFTF